MILSSVFTQELYFIFVENWIYLIVNIYLIFTVFVGGHQEVILHHEARAHEGQRADGELPDFTVHSQNEQRHIYAVAATEKVHVRLGYF